MINPTDFIFFFKIFFFNVDRFLKFLLNLLQYCFCFMNFFGYEACQILASQPGIKLVLPILEGKVLTTGPPEKSPHWLYICLPARSVSWSCPFLLYREPVYTLPGLWYHDPHLRAKFHLLFGRQVFEARYSCILVLSAIWILIYLWSIIFFIGHKCVCSVLSLSIVSESLRPHGL